MTGKEEDAIAELRSRDLFGNLMIRWNFEDKVFTDYMGVPVSRTVATAMRGMIRDHLKKSPADLAQVGNKIFKQHMPRMHGDSPMSPEVFE